MGALGWLEEKYEAASNEVSDAVDYVEEGAGEVADDVAEVADDVGGGVMDAASNVPAALPAAVDVGPSLDIGTGPGKYWRTLEDTLGDNRYGFGVDMVNQLQPGFPGMGVLGKVMAPIGLMSSMRGLMEETKNIDDPRPGESQSVFNANNFINNFTGVVGGSMGTTALLAEGATFLGGGAGAGAVASAAGAGASVVGAAAAGLTAGYGMAVATDSEYSQDRGGKTAWDHNTEAANMVGRGVNRAVGSDEDGLPGTIAGSWLAATGAVPAVVEGAGNIATNTISSGLSYLGL